MIQCNEIINAISTSVARDKRIINGYSKDEMVTQKIKVNGVLRNCRMFTIQGIERYIQEGNIYSYENVCEYFGVDTLDPKNKEIIKYMDKKNKFITKKILKWLFGKRKQDKSLGKSIKYDELVEWMKDYEDDIDDDKYKFVMEFGEGYGKDLLGV